MASSFNVRSGLEKEWPFRRTSVCLFVLVLFFYIFTIGSYLHTGIAPLENRVNYHKPFLSYVLGKNLDELVIVCGTSSWLALSLSTRLKILAPVSYLGFVVFATLYNQVVLDVAILSSFPVMLFFLIYNHFKATKILQISKDLISKYLAILFTALAIASLAISSTPLFSIHANQIRVNDYAYDIFLLFGGLSPFLILFLILGSSTRLLLRRFSDKVLRTENTDSFTESNKVPRTIPHLLLIMLISIALTLVPHYPTINHDNQLVSADSGDYVVMLRHMTDSKDYSEFFHQAFVVTQNGDRPLFLVFWYGIAKIVPATPSFISDHLSMILSPALVLSVFLLTRELTSNSKISLLASFITAVSFQTLISIYAGFYANSFALVIGYLSLAFMIRFLKRGGRSNFAAYLTLMVIFVLAHVYTWTILTLVTSIFLVIMYKLNHYERKRIIYQSLVVLLTIVIDLSRTALTNAHGGLSNDVSIASAAAGFSQLSQVWFNLTDTMQNYGGGQFGNFLVLGLALFWLLRANLRQPTSIFLAVFLAIGTLPLLFGNELIQFRVFYDIPFQIPAAIGLIHLERKIGWYVMPPVCIWLLAISLRMVTNFYFVSLT